MVRFTVPPPVAEALMPRDCPHVDCEGEGDTHCWGCHGSGSLPPSLRLLVVEGEWDHDDSRGLYGTPYLDAPAAIVRAIEAGERIGIDVECERCEGDGFRPVEERLPGNNNYEQWKCPACTDGWVRVGSVRPVGVLPITDDEADDCPGVAHLFVLADAPFDDGRRVFGCGYFPCDVSEPMAVYGPAESLVGKFAVVCEDARREL